MTGSLKKYIEGISDHVVLRFFFSEYRHMGVISNSPFLNQVQSFVFVVKILYCHFYGAESFLLFFLHAQQNSSLKILYSIFLEYF